MHEEAAYFGMSVQLKEPGGGWANAELLGGMLWGYGFFGWGFFWTGWSIPISYPAGHDLLFFVLPKKSKQKKGAPEMAKDSLNLRNRSENGKTRFAQTVPVLFSARLRKFKAPSRAGTSKAKPVVG
jgi:hypothetical protein